MSSDDHEVRHRDLGVYVLGALDSAERDRLEQHLARCQSCRDELATLAVLPSLLSRLADTQNRPETAPPPFDGVLARIRRERRRARRRERRYAAVAALATLAAFVVVVVSAVLPNGGDGRAFAAADGQATATVQERAWGMAMQLHVDALPPRPGYSAWAVTGDGHRTQVASWTAVGGPVDVDGACYLAPDEVARLEIVGARDDAVLAVLAPD